MLRISLTAAGDGMGALPVTGDTFLFDGFCLDRRGGGLFREDERGGFAPLVSRLRNI